jgi:DNA-binding transcriptional ArsR family regulator
MNIERSIRDMTAPAGSLSLEARAGAGLECLIGLSTLTAPDRVTDAETWVPALEDCSPDLRLELSRVGRASGKLWLHLLDLAEGDAADLLARVRRLDALELRRYIVGAYVPTWRDLVGGSTLERAAAGDPASVKKLLAHRRYYGGEAAAALSTVLPLSAAQTKRRVLAVLHRFVAEVFENYGRGVVAELEADAQRVKSLARTLWPEDVISAATGYDYRPEPEFSRVVLVPHVAARPWLLLCQHGDARIIGYPLASGAEASLEEEGVRLGRALGDEQRMRILRRLVEGDASLAELADSVGVAKSTAHHHLALLREAGLVSLHGNARRYWYSLRPGVAGESAVLVAELLSVR